MGMEGSAGGSLVSVACEGMEGVDGGLGSRVGGCGGMGMEDFSRLDVHAEMWIGWCNFPIFLAPLAWCGGMETEDWLVERCRFGMSMQCGDDMFSVARCWCGMSMHCVASVNIVVLQGI